MSNIICPECGTSPLVNHQANCSQPNYVDLRTEPCICVGDCEGTRVRRCVMEDES